MKYKKVEIQIVPYLLAKYWDIEHSLIYKPVDYKVSKVQEVKLKLINKGFINQIIKTSNELSNVMKNKH